MCSPRNTNFGMDCSYFGLHSSCLEGTKNLKLVEVWDFFASLEECGGGTQAVGTNSVL